MLGRNVSMMMPAPFSLMHDRFLKSYISTRRTKILGTTRTVLGMRKEGTVFPITLCATAISQVRLVLLPG